MKYLSSSIVQKTRKAPIPRHSRQWKLVQINSSLLAFFLGMFLSVPSLCLCLLTELSWYTTVSTMAQIMLMLDISWLVKLQVWLVSSSLKDVIFVWNKDPNTTKIWICTCCCSANGLYVEDRLVIMAGSSECVLQKSPHNTGGQSVVRSEVKGGMDGSKRPFTQSMEKLKWTSRKRCFEANCKEISALSGPCWWGLKYLKINNFYQPFHIQSIDCV